MASVDDREIFVESQYPAPPFVEGIVRVISDESEEEVVWQEADDPEYALSVDETDESNEIEQPVPTPLQVVDQQAVSSRGGGVEIQAILLIEEVPYISEYETRVVMR